VKLLAGYPGNSALFLNGAGAFATVPVPTLPANIAFTNVNNLFTASQRITVAGISELDLETDGLLYRLLNYQGFWGVYYNPNGWIFKVSSTGYLQSAGEIYPGQMGAGIQGTWYIASHASYGLYVNTGLFLAGGLWSTGVTYLHNQVRQGLDPPNGTGLYTWFVESSNHIRAAGALYDYSRGTPIGHWIQGNPASYFHGQCSSVGGAFAWSYVGKTVTLVMQVSAYLNADGNAAFTLPDGITPLIGFHAPITINCATRPWFAGFLAFGAGGPYVTIYNEGAYPLPAGNIAFYGEVVIPIN
jgi:hypothetical protein